MKSLIAIVALPVLFLSLVSAPTSPAAPLSGRVTLSTIAAQLVVLPEDTTAKYSRDFFKHWSDIDRDGCDTRQNVLIAESKIAPVMASTGCRVLSGQWVSWYDGETVTNPSELDIDHMVALAEAWRSGAYAWSSSQREAFANDLEFAGSLTAVSDTSNGSKSDRDPANWLPPLQSAHCAYATDWVLTKYRWNLTVDSDEKNALSSLTSGSCGQKLVTAPVTASVPAAGSVKAPASISGGLVVRLSGSDRYETSAAISRQFTTGVSVVYIATGEGYADALAAAPAAAAQGGPLLLTASKKLPAAVAKEITRLKPAKIVVAGGSGAVAGSVVSALKKLAPVVRLGGADRYETSRLIIDYAFDSTPTVYLATGTNFPDALSASAAAGTIGAPVILLDGGNGSVDKPTATLMTKLKVSQVNIAGGSGVVSPGVEKALKKTMKVTRLSGKDRYSTSIAINKYAFTRASQAYFAVGSGFADALAGAALAGGNNAPLYVVPQNCVASAIKSTIGALKVQQRVLLGGRAVLGSGVEKLTVCSTAAVKPPAKPTKPPAPSRPGNPGNSKNCGDFNNWSEAQAWYKKYYPYYGDVADLDRENDGVACESLSGAPEKYSRAR